MADSLIYSTALLHKATLWTQDGDFEGLPHVKYFPPKTSQAALPSPIRLAADELRFWIAPQTED